MKTLLKKLKSSRGESLGETLVSLLIASLAIVLLAGAIVTAGRINASLQNDDVVFRRGTPAESVGSATLTMGSDSVSVPVNVYSTENDYSYYEIKNN